MFPYEAKQIVPTTLKKVFSLCNFSETDFVQVLNSMHSNVHAKLVEWTGYADEISKATSQLLYDYEYKHSTKSYEASFFTLSSFASSPLIPMKGHTNSNVFCFDPCNRIRNPANSGCWNPESTMMEFGIQI